jgi:hypothetical protein
MFIRKVIFLLEFLHFGKYITYAEPVLNNIFTANYLSDYD